MIADLFIKILNLSIGAVPIMAALLILRLLFKKAVPRKVFYIAWALVFLRLMVPFSFESDLSFFNHVPKAEVVEENIGTSVVFVENENERVEFPVFINPDRENPNVDWVHHSAITGEVVTGPDITTVPMDKNMILGTIWIFGAAGLFLFGIIGYFAVLKKTKFESVPYTKNIRLSDFFKTPVVCGLFRPKIILPMNFDLDDEMKVKSVIAHECTHIRRRDNLWRLLASFTLYIHWFNPLVWLCYDGFIRDMEVSCDEEVLGKSEKDIRGEYAESLVSLSGSGTSPLYGGVLSFGESAIKERVKCIMNFKKARVFIVIICVMAAVALGVIFLTNPSVIDKPEEYYEISMEKTEALVFDKEKGIDISAKIRNISDVPIYVYPEIELYFYEGNIWMFFGNYYPSEGTVVLNPGTEGVLCGNLAPELFDAVPKTAGKYKIRRQISKDSGNSELIDYAEYFFEIKEESNFVNANDDKYSTNQSVIYKTIKVNKENTKYTTKEGVLYSKDEKKIYMYPPAKEGNFTILPNVEELFKLAFFGNNYLNEITIPNTVKKVGDACFEGCTNLEIVNLNALNLEGSDHFENTKLNNPKEIKLLINPSTEKILKELCSILIIEFNSNIKLEKEILILKIFFPISQIEEEIK